MNGSFLHDDQLFQAGVKRNVYMYIYIYIYIYMLTAANIGMHDGVINVTRESSFKYISASLEIMPVLFDDLRDRKSMFFFSLFS